MELENLGNGRIVADVPHGLPVQGRPVELPNGGMPRTSGNEDGNVRTFYAPACPGHCDDFGGGKYPPLTLPPMRHDITLEYTEWKAPCHHTVHHRSGSEEATVSGGGIEGDHGEGL